MNKFLFKSSETDFQKLVQSIKTIHKNVLYMTYQIDKIRRDITAQQTDKGLQTQVDEYFREADSAVSGLEPDASQDLD